jgi:hypothetical protein
MADIWDMEKVRRRLNECLDLIEARETQAGGDMAGGGCPAIVGVLFVAEKIADESFYGTVETQCKGFQTVKPTVSKQSFRMDEVYKDFLK